MSSVTDSSAEIRWKRISSVESELSDYYEYVIEYKKDTSSNWQDLLKITHSETTSDTYQYSSLSGLTHNTEYDVRLTSYREVGTNREQTDRKTSTFQTDCIGKKATFTVK